MVSTDASPLAEDRDQYREEKYGENVERASPCGDEREIRKLNERKRTVNAFFRFRQESCKKAMQRFRCYTT